MLLLGSRRSTAFTRAKGTDGAWLGEFVQWDASLRDWLEGRSEKVCLIGMIDDANNRLFARSGRGEYAAGVELP
jgi:hypothetical protein